ncbi:MAG: hypothetical protein HY301_16080 [Verrucomicrobia bacterium]|nr:hypothetical protein [Verrucomicrobiota bacterium]
MKPARECWRCRVARKFCAWLLVRVCAKPVNFRLARELPREEETSFLRRKLRRAVRQRLGLLAGPLIEPHGSSL